MIERVRREIETWGKLSKKMKLGILVKKKRCNETEKKKSKAAHEEKSAHTNEALFEGAEGEDGDKKRRMHP